MLIRYVFIKPVGETDKMLNKASHVIFFADLLSNKQGTLILGSLCNLSRIVRNRVFAYAKTKTQISFAGNREADQSLCFRYTDSSTS